MAKGENNTVITCETARKSLNLVHWRSWLRQALYAPVTSHFPPGIFYVNDVLIVLYEHVALAGCKTYHTIRNGCDGRYEFLTGFEKYSHLSRNYFSLSEILHLLYDVRRTYINDVSQIVNKSELLHKNPFDYIYNKLLFKNPWIVVMLCCTA